MRSVLILFAISLVFIFLSIANRPYQPFDITDDFSIPENYVKSADIPKVEVGYNFTQYTDKAKGALSKITEASLLGFSCGDRLIRTDQGVYIFEYLKTPEGHIRRIKNKEFIEFMREKEKHLPRGKKVLTAKICELTNGNILLFYSIGRYSIELADSLTTRSAIAYSDSNESFVELLPKGALSAHKIVKIGDSTDHLTCDTLFQLSKGYELFLICQEDQDFQVNFSVVKIDLRNGRTSSLERCSNKYEKKLETLCSFIYGAHHTSRTSQLPPDFTSLT